MRTISNPEISLAVNQVKYGPLVGACGSLVGSDCDEPSVVVFGSYVQDLTGRCAALPETGETIVRQFVTGPGGRGSKQAVAAASAGAALSVTKFGTAPSMPSEREIARSLKVGRIILNPPPHRVRTPAAR